MNSKRNKTEKELEKLIYVGNTNTVGNNNKLKVDEFLKLSLSSALKGIAVVSDVTNFLSHPTRYYI